MTDLSVQASKEILAADGTPLKEKLAQTNRKRRHRAFALVIPLLLFVLITFRYDPQLRIRPKGSANVLFALN